MKKTTVNFLWHMHQPYYRDDQSGESVMPWVFLHAIKDYYDMPWYLERIPGIKATFNLVPSLMVQLKAYACADVRDKLLIALRKEVGDLREEERRYLAEHLFFANVEHMIKPLPRYFELYEKRMAYDTYEEVAAHFDDAQWLDLEVLFLLSWCGVWLKRHDDTVKALLQKARGFSQHDKLTLLEALHRFVASILPYYAKLMQEGRIEISTTPFDHPISPLLMDITNAKKANPATPIPKLHADLSSDAREQTRRAIAYYTELFGHPPTGFWPAEGAVSFDFMRLLRDQRILWAATDEEILYKTLKKTDKEAIYRRNRLRLDEERSIALFFRDHALSDLIGFTYSGWDAQSAVQDFISRLRAIHDAYDHDTLVNVILDGENAWEYYPDNAFAFFETLYRELRAQAWCETATMGEAMECERIPRSDLFSLEPGSWIGGNFDIWIGHPEKNRAWELLYRTRNDYEKDRARLPKQIQDAILKEFLIAESSDWFWWFGDDHHTVEKGTFDALFRKHLINIYHLMEQTPPQELFTPIVSTPTRKAAPFLREPVAMISPVIDGRETTLFDWMSAGEFDLTRELSAMNMEDFPIEKVRFGWDETYCYFGLEGEIRLLASDATLELVCERFTERFTFTSTPQSRADGTLFCSGELFELRLPKKRVWNEALQFRLIREGKIAQQLPLYSKITLSSFDHLERYWYI